MRWVFIGIVALNLLYLGWHLLGPDDERPGRMRALSLLGPEPEPPDAVAMFGGRRP